MLLPINFPGRIFSPGSLLGHKRVGSGSGATNPTLDFSGGTLPSGVTYVRAGTAWNCVAGTGAPKWESVSANAARLAVDELDLSMRNIGILFEPGITNYAGYNRGTTDTGWTNSGFTKSAVQGIDQTGTKARKLVANSDGATYTYATGLPTTAGVYVFSLRARAIDNKSGAWAAGNDGYGKIWITLTHDGGQVEQRDISADIQAFLANGQPAWVPVFVSAYCGSSGLESVGIRVDDEGTGIRVDFMQLELSANGRGVPTSPVSTEGVASATRAADEITITLLGIGAYTFDGDDLASTFDESDLAYRDIADWRDREQDCIKQITWAQVSGSTYSLYLCTADRNLPNSGYQPGQPSEIMPENIYETDLTVSGTYQDQLFPLGYTFNAVFA